MTDIDIYYNEIVFALKWCADRHIPKVPKSCMKHYWSVALDDLKQSSIDTHNLWVSSGKPRQGPLYDCMKDAKYKYKLAVRDAIRVYEQRFTDDLYNHMLSKDMNNFWKTWSRKTSKNIISVNTIDGHTDSAEIVDVFKNKFDINYVPDQCPTPPVSADRSFLAWKISVEDVDNAVHQHMKRGKAAGVDNLTLEHIIISHPILLYHLCRLFNLMMKHSYVPCEFGRGIIIPLIKDKCGDLSCSDNYRGITVSPVISKVFELCLLCKYGHFLTSHELQLGFKKNIGCAPGLFLVQSVTSFFTFRKSSVYVAALDASKAFDRINHKMLFQKLVQRGAPQCFLGVLVNWYSKLWSSVR